MGITSWNIQANPECNFMDPYRRWAEDDVAQIEETR